VTDRDAPPETPACYRHPERPALLRCSRCERPICGDDAIEAPVGYQCPECAEGGQPVRHLRDLVPDFTVTKVMVAIIAVVFLVTSFDQGLLVNRFALRPVLVGLGEWWLLVTSGFLHAGIVHVAFNGILLWRLGQMLEPALGHRAFGALYAAGLAGGSLGVVFLAWLWAATPLNEVPVLGAILTTNPGIATLGASGAVFGLIGAAMAGLRERGIDPWRTDIGGLAILNLILTFMIPMISVGGHVGGFLAGMAAGRLLFVGRERRGRATVTVSVLAVVMLAVAILLGNLIVGAIGL
jgi:membrane associated rhomboid family serine protease